MVYFTWYNVLSVLLSIIGLGMCVWAYGKCRRSGWLLLAASFLIGVSTAVVLPTIERARHKAWQAQHSLSPDAQKAYMEESNALAKKYYPDGGPVYVPHYFRFPFGGILMLAGLWLIAQQEPRKDAEQNAGGNAASPRASA